MTPRQIALVQESFRLVLPIREQAAALFYDRLFTLDPSLRPLFAGTDMGEQARKLMMAIGMVVGGLTRLDAILGEVERLAVRHVDYGVEEGHYATVGDALLWTLEAGLGDAFTAETKGAWAEAYGTLSGAMIEAARAGTLRRAS
jgi:hemoglobin-like flavoprotein